MNNPTARPRQNTVTARVSATDPCMIFTSLGLTVFTLMSAVNFDTVPFNSSDQEKGPET